MLYIETDFDYRVDYLSVKNRILRTQSTYQAIWKSDTV